MLIRSTGDPAIDAFIEFELRYNQTRWAEIWLSCIMTLMGAVFLTPGSTFSVSHGYDFIASIVSETTAGWLGLIIGAGRLLALYVNGNVRRSPYVRVFGCQLGFLFWGGMLYGFVTIENSHALSGAVPVWAVLCMAELHSSRKSTKDLVAYLRYKAIRNRSGLGRAKLFAFTRRS